MKLLLIVMNAAVIAAVLLLYLIGEGLGWQFMVGVAVGGTIYQCAHRVTYGTWFE